ncbi:metallophosphoesterase [Siccirubricoccus deserti]|uniref:DNA repair exonuclease n=1 Tax=Siccirubricoccus deserti TaxID=2013562 RepID=A0A9X0R141_9PROT|nr:DNA repair exonuclease [Siccirubricoccus deserti]MBC4016412.1 DNA repair exonuclease [Siccirubricoccus deserti]GGC49223.1 metallophosphoesterase [Siccirubricoccus deserti]
MANFRFLHAADLHLDSPLRGLEARPDVPADRIRGATREALQNLVALAIEEQVDFVVLAGDLYDGEWRDWGTGHFLLGQLARLTRAGIRVVAISGNHDAESILTRQLRFPEGATMLPTRPESHPLPELGVVVHGQGYARREMLENLVPRYPRPVAGAFNIGLLHTSVNGRPGHAGYAPCALAELLRHGYDYWALGHIHAREVLAEGDCWVVFPGNLQGRHVREAGAKGAMLVTVRDGRVAAVEHRSLDTVRWARVEVALDGAADAAEVLNRVRLALEAALSGVGSRLLAARVVLRGATPLHGALQRDPGDIREQIRGEGLNAAPEGFWLEDVTLATAPAGDTGGLGRRSDAFGRMVAAIEAAEAEAVAARTRDYAAALLNRSGDLRSLLGEEHPAVAAARGEVSPEILARARVLLLARLAEE